MDGIREQFPILSKEINGHPLVYFDNAATTQKPQFVIDSLVDYYQNHNANIHRGIHTLANEATKLWEEAHLKVKFFINADSMEEVFFVRNSTEGINFVVNTYGRQRMQRGDIVVISELEHHSNIVPWQILAKEIGIRIEWIPTRDDGTLDTDYLEYLIRKDKKKIKVVAVSHVSNVLGVENNVKQIVELAHSVEAICVIDAAQSIPHHKIDVKDLNCDFLVFSGHKIYGPTGVGVVYGRKELLEELEPWMGGGEMIRSVTKTGSEWNDLPWKFEAGTPDIAGGVGLGAAIDWFNKNLKYPKLETHISSLIKSTLDGFSQLKKVSVLGTTNPDARVGLVSFVVEGMHPHDIAGLLDENGIAIRAGFHCAQPLHAKINLGASARVSFAAYNTVGEVEQFIISLEQIINTFK